MRFEERNPILLQEAKILLENKPIQQIGHNYRSEGAIFYSLGKFHSEALQKDIYGGLKYIYTKGYFPSSLANLILIENLFPETIEKLPLFMGGIVDSEGKLSGILMEDFSCNNQYKHVPWSDFHSDRIPKHMVPYLNGESGLEDFARVFVDIYNANQITTRLLDLNMIDWRKDIKDKFWELFLDFDIKSEKIKPYLVHNLL